MFTPVVTDSEENGLTLLSVSQDRTVVEYDLGNSNIGSGIIIKNSRKIEQSHRPLAAMLMKSDNPVNTEHFLLTFNSGYKFKLYNPTTRACRKTVLGPSYADDIKEISSIPGLSGGDYLAFSSSQRVRRLLIHVKQNLIFEQVVGVVKLPLDGNPYKSMGLIAHPGQVSHVVPTSNGVQLLTAGGPDGTVYMWTINYSILETQIQSSAAAVANPFLNLLDSTGLGENGPAYTELEDYFYYAQLRRYVLCYTSIEAESKML